MECDLHKEQRLPSDLLVLTTVTALYVKTLEKLYRITTSDPLNVKSYTSYTGHKSIRTGMVIRLFLE